MNNPTSSVSVCYITDERYLLPTLVSMSSLLRSRAPSTTYDVYLVVSEALPGASESLAILRRKHPSCKIELLVAPPLEEPNLAERKNHVSKAALLKYNLCHLLPHLSKVLYIDGDTVVQKDLSPLFTTDLGDHYLSAAQALIGYWEKYRVWHYDQKIGVPFDDYFNSGVMLLDLDAFRRNDLPRKLFEFSSTRGDLVFMDQDAFNVVCRGRVKPMAREFNLMPECAKVPSMAEAASRPRDAAILHFAGRMKPWEHVAAPWFDLYLPHFRRSPVWSWGRYARLIAADAARRVRVTVKQPIVYARSKAMEQARLATRRYRNREIDARREDLDAFMAQYFFSARMMDTTGSGVNVDEPRTPEVVVSLTTIAPRLYDIATTIESLLQQTMKPDKLVLWLDEKKVAPEDVPLSLQRQVARGLTIRFCEDIGPHTKLVPALREFPDAVVITVDDDVLYPQHLVERLFRNYKADPSKIYCTRARHISILETRDFDYQKNWPNLHKEVEGLNVLPLGVGGVLYPPRVLHPDVFDLDSQKRLAPKADDIWFKTMSLRQRVVCKRIAGPAQAFPLRPFSQEVSLHHTNVHGRANERQIAACFDHYSCWDILGARR